MSEKNSTPVHLAVDLGASGGRVIAGRVEDGKLLMEAISRFPNEPVRIQNQMQWNVLSLWQAISDGLREATKRFSNIQSVGVATWGVDYVLVDDQDSLTGPARHYRDSRTNGMVEKACDIVPRSEIFDATGLQFMQINSAIQLLAAKEAGERSLEFADGFLMMGDFFHWLLSGKRSIEATNASTTQLLDPRNKQWRTDLIEKFGLPSKIFVPVTEPGTNLGNVQESVATQTGLDGVPVIVPATHDTASAVIAVPAKEFAPAKPDWCYISSGTWSLMGCEIPEPKINERCAELNFTNEGGVLGSTRLLKNIGGLWVLQQIRQSVIRRGEDVDWDQMVQEAEQAPAFELLLDPDEADFVAPDDMIDAITAYAKRTNQNVPTTNSVFYRAALEGLALRYRVCKGMLESLVDHSINTIHVVGGGSQNALLCQMTADACNCDVVAGPVEATAIGNLLMQMIGLGAVESIGEARELVRNSFETNIYKPRNPQAWEGPAERFLQLQ